MMMMGEERHHDPMVHVPPWQLFDGRRGAAGVSYTLPVSGIAAGDTGGDCLPYLLRDAAVEAALRGYLPSSDEDGEEAELAGAADAPVDAYSCDEFRMYEFKVRRCARGRSHDWTECPFAHPGEKARRRDPREYHYSGTACPDFRKGGCKRGDACEFAHGVFECWLHPARYRTQPCKDGIACRRRVCFFAHTPEQLRVLIPQLQQQPGPRPTAAAASHPESYDGSPLRRHGLESIVAKSLISSSPTSTLISPPRSPPSDSPPMSPNGVPLAIRRASWPVASSASDVLESLRQLRLGKAKSAPSSWALQLGAGGFGSPKAALAGFVPGFCSLPSTPTRPATNIAGGGALSGVGLDLGLIEEDEPAVRVESGRALRAKMFERLDKEGMVGKAEVAAPAPAPDVDWVSDLVN